MTHVPVMVQEVIEYLVHDRAELILDATVGAGGHAKAVLETVPMLKVFGVDRDAEALREARQVLSPFGNRATLAIGRFSDAGDLLPGRADGVLADLGVSSLQLDRGERGFSYGKEGPLAMRMSSEGKTAEMVLKALTPQELSDALSRLGDVRGAGRIARAIHAAAFEGRLHTTGDLKRTIDSALAGHASPDLLSRIFQAIRIIVNDEREELTMLLDRMHGWVNPDARIVIISYHSGEDRLVKEFFRRESTSCLCPPGVPVCRCGHSATLERLTRRVVKPQPDEIRRNPRARSARLRAARFIN